MAFGDAERRGDLFVAIAVESIRFAKIDDGSVYKNIGIAKWHLAGNFMEGEDAMSKQNRLVAKGELSLLVKESLFCCIQHFNSFSCLSSAFLWIKCIKSKIWYFKD